VKKQKILFIDRDGTLIVEPEDKQVDSLHKLRLVADVIPTLLRFKSSGFRFVMVTNQDGLGTARFPQENFTMVHESMLQLFTTQGIEFDDVLICPHLASDGCECRKPRVGLVLPYMREARYDKSHSYVIGDRQTDIELADKMGVTGILLNQHNGWLHIADTVLNKHRVAKTVRKTSETDIVCTINLDDSAQANISTGINFLDHMLEQMTKHAGIAIDLNATGDLHIDDHHTVEDAAIVIGETIRKALGDKRGIARYGFVLPMDESRALVTIDLSGRGHLSFNGTFSREKVGDLSCELVEHFFRSLADSMKATLHIEVQGSNCHHQVEAIFKALGRSLRQAINQQGVELPTTKGVL